MLKFYWELGAGIVVKQKSSSWGDGFLKQLSKDLTAEFPEMKGFSYRNIKFIRQWYLFWNQKDLKGKQLVSQFTKQGISQLKNKRGKESVVKIEDKKSPQLVDEFKYKSIFEIPWGHNIVVIQKCKKIEEALFYVQKTIENG